MAANPNAIFSQALAVGPRQIPLSELNQQMAQTAATQQETALNAQQTTQMAQQNEMRRRQLEDDQAVRDVVAKYSRSVPVTAPNASMPTGGVDNDGNPLPLPPMYHPAAAAGAVQLQVPDIGAMHAELLRQGRVTAADTLYKTIQGIQTTDLENNKLRLTNAQAANDRKNEIYGSILKTADEDPASLPGVLAQAGITLENEGHIPKGAGANLTLADARAGYRVTSGVQDPIRKALDDLQAKEATTKLTGEQAEVQKQLGRKTAAEAGMSEKELQLMNQALSDPASLTSSVDGLVDPVKYPEINARTKKGVVAALMLGGRKAAEQVLTSARTHIDTLEENKIKETDPDILKAREKQEINIRVGVARAMAGTGPYSSITDEGERNKAIIEGNKIDEDYAEKVGAARQLQDFVDLAAKNGNKAAPGMIGIAELKQLVNRVNRNELQAVGAGAGNAADRIQAFTGKWIDGQPIPPDILRDTKILSGVMENAAGRTYDLKRQALARNHSIPVVPRIQVPGTEMTAQPAAVPPAVQRLLSPKTVTPGLHTLTDGTKWVKAKDGTITPQ